MEDGCCCDAKDEHEASLTDEPFAHAAFCGDQRTREAVAVLERDEGEEVKVGEFAFEHEVDAEDAGGDDVHHARHPLGGGGEEKGSCGGDEVLNLFTDGIDAEPLGEGKVPELLAYYWQSAGQVRAEVLDVVQHGRHRDDEEEAEHKKDGDHEAQDGDGA